VEAAGVEHFALLKTGNLLKNRAAQNAQNFEIGRSDVRGNVHGRYRASESLLLLPDRTCGRRSVIHGARLLLPSGDHSPSSHATTNGAADWLWRSTLPDSPTVLGQEFSY